MSRFEATLLQRGLQTGERLARVSRSSEKIARDFGFKQTESYPTNTGRD